MRPTAVLASALVRLATVLTTAVPGGDGGGGGEGGGEGGGGNEGGEGRKKKGGAGGGDGEGGGTLFPATHAHRADALAGVPA